MSFYWSGVDVPIIVGNLVTDSRRLAFGSPAGCNSLNLTTWCGRHGTVLFAVLSWKVSSDNGDACDIGHQTLWRYGAYQYLS